MELIDYISTDHITVKPNNSVLQTLSVFDEINYTHLPIIKHQKLVGNVAKEDLSCVDDPSKTLDELEYIHSFFFAKEDDTLLELFSNFAINNTNILPIVNLQHNYVGYIDLNDMLDCFADTPFLNTEGNIILLEKNTTAYSMSEVCQIVESNDNSVLGCFLFHQTDEKTQITLKVKSVNINELVQSFRRYDYTILNNLTEDSYLEDLKKRSEYFIKYLNI
ncbi:CBS domain-containing protein [Wenyingzhuangia sp. IMCC45533]